MDANVRRSRSTHYSTGVTPPSIVEVASSQRRSPFSHGAVHSEYTSISTAGVYVASTRSTALKRSCGEETVCARQRAAAVSKAVQAASMGTHGNVSRARTTSVV
eukprot:3086679-Pleurochrysis_carterae.AAC.3